MTLKLCLARCIKPTNGEKFILPAWATRPSSGAALHVTKNGDTMSTLKLDGGSKYYMFGRAPKTCESGHGFQINHPTLSRQHAVIVHGENETLYLIDLDSSHGTWVNHERVEPYNPRLLENGNIISFGQSTRRYVVRLFPKEDGSPLEPRLSFSCDHFAGLSVSTGSHTHDEDSGEEEDDENDDTASPATRKESQKRRQSLMQARIFSNLNARVSYPSPKSLLGRKAGDSPVSPSISATAVAEAVAATASPAPSPMLCAGSKRSQLTDKASKKNAEQQWIQIPPLTALPPAACESHTSSRSRSLSLCVSPRPVVGSHSPAHSMVPLLESQGGRFRSNSTSATLVKKRPAPYPMYPNTIVRRRSVVEHRRVSFCNSPEFIVPRESGGESTSTTMTIDSDCTTEQEVLEGCSSKSQQQLI